MIFYLAADSNGFRQLLTRQDEAKKLDPNFQTLDIAPNKDAMQIALQELLTEADKLQQIVDQVPKGTVTVQVPKPEPERDKPLDLDDAFDAAPVTHQLDLAARAMQNARTEIIDQHNKLKTLTSNPQR
jgi:hypothetical protein